MAGEEEPRKALADLEEAICVDPRFAAAMADLSRLLTTCSDVKLRNGSVSRNWLRRRTT